ncbi:MAG: AAA family ATPase [Candidatus Dormibacteraceae bacterium]
MTKVTHLERNPFRPGMGLDPPYLADRQHQLQRFARFLDGFPEFPRNVRVTGLRGVGKTVLLQRYAMLAEEAGWVVVRRELGENLQHESAFGLALVDDCRQAVERVSRRAAVGRKASAAARAAFDLLGGISVSLVGVGIGISLRTPSAPVAPRPVLDDQLFAAIKATCRAATEAGRRGVLICYDEAHVLRDSRFERRFPLSGLLAAVARAQLERVPVMLVACGLPPLTENLALAKSYSERMFQAEVLDALTPPEDVNALVQPLLASRRPFEPELGELVRADTKGFPFQLQFFGALLWDSLPASEPITCAHFHALRPAILEALDHAFFDARLARSSRTERQLLCAIAADGEETSVRAVLMKMSGDRNLLNRLVARLIAKGLVYRPERTRLAFSVPMFGEYLRRKGLVGSGEIGGSSA